MSTRVPQLDAIRGVAIVTVILHNQRDQFPSPLYALMLVFMFVVVPLVRPAEGQAVFDRSSPWWAYPLFLQNLLVPLPTQATGPLSVSWSLALEEQFYLVWPWFVRYCSLARLRQVAISVICVSPALRLFLAAYGVQLYSNTFCRLDGLMAGALLAVAVRSPTFRPSDSVRGAWVALCIAVPATFVARSLNANWIVFSLSAAASAAFVYLALFAPQTWLQRALSNQFIVYTGTISYGLYVLHKIPFDVAKAAHLDQNAVLALPLLLLACYAAAALSWHLIEKPFLRLKRVFESEPPGVGRTRHDVLAGLEQTATLSWTSR